MAYLSAHIENKEDSCYYLNADCTENKRIEKGGVLHEQSRISNSHGGRGRPFTDVVAKELKILS